MIAVILAVLLAVSVFFGFVLVVMVFSVIYAIISVTIKGAKASLKKLKEDK